VPIADYAVYCVAVRSANDVFFLTHSVFSTLTLSFTPGECPGDDFLGGKCPEVNVRDGEC